MLFSDMSRVCCWSFALMLQSLGLSAVIAARNSAKPCDGLFGHKGFYHFPKPLDAEFVRHMFVLRVVQSREPSFGKGRVQSSLL